MPVCSPVFFTPVVPYYSDTYLVREQPVQQFIIVDHQPEQPQQPEQPVAAEQGPPVQPQEAGRQVAAEQQEEAQPRGVALLPDDLLQELMIEGTELFHRGDYHEAAKRFFRVTMADRLNADATLAYAVARFATGDYQVASLAVRRGVRRFPEVVDSTFDIRARYGEPKDFESHLIKLEEFVRRNPDEVDGWVVLGFVRHFSGRRDLAAQTVARLREQSPSDEELADIFLNAKPLPAPAQPDDQEGAETLPATTGEAPLLPGVSDVEDEARALITIE